MTEGSFWRRAPAAELRGLMKGAWPVAAAHSFSRSNAEVVDEAVETFLARYGV